MAERDPVLMIGYDVESSQGPETVSRFLGKVEEVHSEFEAPSTFFIVGKVAENCWEELAELRDRCDLFDYQQHTYSHVLLKTVCMDDGKDITLVKAGSLEEIEEEVSRTNRILKERLGVDCWGLTGPWGYYRGLCDRPDILEILSRNGIKFVRTWGRNEKDYQPVPLDVQPFWYEVQGFPEIMEFPIHGWQDVHWRNVNGWERTREYLNFLKKTVEIVAERGLIWSHGTHDWSSIKEDAEMSVIRGLLEHAGERGLRFMDYKSFYLGALGRKIR